MTKMRVNYLGSLRTECIYLDSKAKIETDAPLDNMGKGELFSPTDLFAVSVGACMVTLMGIQAKKMRFDLQKTHAEVEKEMDTRGKRRVGKLVIRIQSLSSPNQMEQKLLETAALDCPVHLSIHPDIRVEVEFVWGI